MIQKIYTFISSIKINDIILGVLGFDTLRSVIASLGIFKRDAIFRKDNIWIV